MSGVFFLFPQQVINSTGQQFVLNNASVIADGYQIISGLGSNEIRLLINIKSSPSGTNPTLTFTMQEIDPIDQTTAAGSSVVSAALSTSGVTQLTMTNSTVGTVKVSWHLTGTSNPTFTGVNVTILQKVAGSNIISKITDGTNVSAVKSASTAPVVTDPALVVAITPNNSGANAVQVNGNRPEGTLVSGNINPVVVAGHDQNGLSSILNVDGYGNLKVVTALVPSNATVDTAFGQVTTGAAGTLSTIRATVYNEQTTNGQRSLVSTNALDIAATGTGARTVTITYYDASLNGPFTETVSLNGLTAVPTVNSNICFIEKMVVATIGSTGSNQGIISLYTANNGTGTVIGSIAVSTIVTAGNVGDNRTLWAHHYVANNRYCYLLVISSATTTGNDGVEFLRLNDPINSFDADIQITESIVLAPGPQGSSSIFRPVTEPIIIAGPNRITMYAVSSGAAQVFIGGFRYSDIPK